METNRKTEEEILAEIKAARAIEGELQTHLRRATGKRGNVTVLATY